MHFCRNKHHSKNYGLAVLTSILLLSACDPQKDPLPGDRKAYLSLGGGQLNADSSLKGKAITVPHARNLDSFPQALVNFDQGATPIKINEKTESSWSVNIGTSADNEHRLISHPVSNGQFIYTSDAHGKISAINAADGSVLWQFDSVPEEQQDNVFGAGLAIDGKTLFVATAIGEVIARDLTTGKMMWRTREQLWRTSVDAPVRVMPAAKGDRVFVTTIDGRTVALSKKDGKALWTHHGLSEISNILGGASPVVKDDHVVASYSSGEVQVLRADAGTSVWSETITTALRTDSVSSIPHIVGNPIVDHSTLYVISHGGRMAAFDLTTGLTVWQQDLGSVHSPVLIGNYIYIVDNNNNAVCLEKNSGKIVWVNKLPLSSEGKALAWTSPIAVNDKLVMANSAGKVLFLSLTKGEKVKEFDLKDGVSVSPIAVGGALYFQLDSGTLVKY